MYAGRRKRRLSQEIFLMSARRLNFCLGALGATLLTGCLEKPLSTLDPAGPAAADIAQVWWVMLIGFTLVWLLMVGLVLYAVMHRKRDGKAPRRTLLIGGGLVLPLVTVFALLVYGIGSGQGMLPLPTGEPVYRVDVRGHQWWWEVRYPDAAGGQRHSAGELHIPAGQPVDVHVTTADVIHSFWAPRLGGKIDAIPGRTNVIRLFADEPGTYYGVCAEFCGAQHARMHFIVQAHEPDALAERLAALDRPAPTDMTTHGAQAFARDCLACHSLDPASASTQPGPNLADVGLRRTLGSGTLPNGPDELRDWLANHQARKPGNRMPDQNLSADDVEAIATFLESLP